MFQSIRLHTVALAVGCAFILAACSNCSGAEEEPETPELTFVPGDLLSLRAQPRTTENTDLVILNNTSLDLALDDFTVTLGDESSSVLFGIDQEASECTTDTVLAAGESCRLGVTFSPVVHQRLSGEGGADDEVSRASLAVTFSADGESHAATLELEGRGRLGCTVHEDAISAESPEWEARYAETVGTAEPSPSELRRVVQALNEEERAEWESEIRSRYVPWMNMQTGFTIDPNSIHVYGEGGLTAGDFSDVDDEIFGAIDDAERAGTGGRRTLGLAVEVKREAADDGSIRWIETNDGTECLLYFPSTTSDSSLSVTAKASTIAHEVFHCYQFQFYQSRSSTQYGRWLREGLAEYVGEVYALGSPEGLGRFNSYIGEREDLFQRDYDAMPFFSHVQLSGTEVLRSAPGWVETDESSLFLDIVGGLSDRTMYSWASGMWEDSELGPHWDTSVPGHADATERTDKIQIDGASMGGESSTALRQVSPTHVEFTPEENKFYRVIARGAYGKWRTRERDGDEIDETILGEKDFTICSGDRCKCPEGDEPLEDVIEVVREPAKFALAAPPGETGSIEFREVEPTCCGTDELPGNGAFEEMVGVWTLDNDELRDWASVLGSEPSCGYAVGGAARLEIYPNGRFTKRYSNLTKIATCQYGDTVTQSENKLSGTVNGCISQSRVTRGNYHFEVTHIRDGTSGTVIQDDDPVMRADGRTDEFLWATFGPRNYDTREENGIVNFPTPERMEQGGNIDAFSVPGSFTWVFEAPLDQ